MSDSEGDLSSAANIPADAEIEQCIRAVVREAVKKEEAVTVNLARTRAEQRLGLDAGFLKDNTQWKAKSKELISAAFEEPASPEAHKVEAKPAAKAGTKRKSDETQESRKKQKKTAVSDSEADGDLSSEIEDEYEAKEESAKAGEEAKSEDESALSDPPESEAQNGQGGAEGDESDLSSVIDDPPKKRDRKKGTTATATKAKPKSKPKPAATSKKAAESKSTAPDDNDSSDLSSVIDDPAPLKKGRKKKPTSPRPKPKPIKDLSPDEEEIKRLQSWLLKCGIRKLWHRELAPFDTNKAKIAHLKWMLEEAGMTGRYSVEKARQVKERRELAAELEAATEFNKTWGHGDGSEEESGGEAKQKEDEGEVKGEEKAVPGKRARPKGFVDFGDSDEESE